MTSYILIKESQINNVSLIVQDIAYLIAIITKDLSLYEIYTKIVVSINENQYAEYKKETKYFTENILLFPPNDYSNKFKELRLVKLKEETDITELPPSSDIITQSILIIYYNQQLKMSIGKIYAQIGHITQLMVKEINNLNKSNKLNNFYIKAFNNWLINKRTILIKHKDIEELSNIKKSIIFIDSETTEVPDNSLTVVTFLPGTLI